MREHNEVHKRAQDISKEHWLCGSCEDRFSVWETKFANNVFYPFVDEGACVANYDSWMSKFCTSLSWRTLSYIRSKNKKDNTDNKDPSYIEAIDKVEKHLAGYLLGNIDNLNQYEQHLFPLEPIEATTENGLPPNINRYFLRTMAMDIAGNSTDLYIYTKLPSFIVLGCVRSKELKKMRSSRIALKSGKISPRRYWWPDGFINYIVEKAKAVTETYERIPEQHKESFEEYIRKNPEKAANSRLMEAFLHDYNQFGKKVFR